MADRQKDEREVADLDPQEIPEGQDGDVKGGLDKSSPKLAEFTARAPVTTFDYNRDGDVS